MKQIEVHQLMYRYPKSKELALDGISFTADKGECIGLIGRSLSGKSTLCQALTGLVPHFYKGAYGGSVHIGGVNVREAGVSDITKRTAIVFQNPLTQLSGAKLTVFEEAAFGLENRGISRSEMRKRVEEALSFLGIYELRNQNPLTLSGGQLQRLAIASMLVMKPDVFILDEPTSQLDPIGTKEVFKVVSALKEAGTTVIMAEHKVDQLAAFADRILLLDKGRSIDYDTPQKIFSRKDLELYGVRTPAAVLVCRELGIRDPITGQYPVTLSEIPEKELKQL